jgi:polysaccharide biosynthesis protein PslG
VALRGVTFPSANSVRITRSATEEAVEPTVPRIGLVVIVALACISLLATGCSMLTSISRPHTKTATVPHHMVVFGMSDPSLLTESTAVQDAQLAGMKRIGITSIRFDANWASVQPDGPESYDWSQIDNAVSSARQAGMSVDLIIDGCPQWAAVPNAGNSSFVQPASSAAYSQFAADVAQRYAPQGVNIFEIWNEPNISTFWQPNPDPAAYTDDLKAAYASIKKVDPQATIVSGGLAPIVNASPGFMTAVSFLQAMYQDGAKGYFDALGYHPYSFPDLPATRVTTTGWSQMDESDPSLRSIMVSYGDGDKPIWLTEFGAPSAGANGVGQFMQAENFSEAIQDSKTTDWIGALYIYTWQDTPGTAADDYFGLLTAQGARKPAFSQVARSIRART